MKTLKIFGWLSHFLVVAVFLLGIVFTLMIYSEFSNTDQKNWMISFMGNEVSTSDNKYYLLLFLGICYALYLLYFYAVWLFNLCVRSFEKRSFFHAKTIRRFRIIGYLFIFIYAITWVMGNVFSIHSERMPSGSTDFSHQLISELQHPFGGLITGFLFIVLAEVFNEAKKQKEENALTI